MEFEQLSRPFPAAKYPQPVVTTLRENAHHLSGDIPVTLIPSLRAFLAAANARTKHAKSTAQ